MFNENIVPELDIPVVSIIKETSIIDNSDIISRLYNALVEKDYNPLMVFLNNPSCKIIPDGDTLIIPEQLMLCDMPIVERVKNMRHIINKRVWEKGHDIAITDSFCGVFPMEGEGYSNYLNMEIIETFDPDYIIAHILAENYLMPQAFFHQFELKIRRDIDAVVLSELFFDIVKYRENQTKRYLSFSQKTINSLIESLSKHIDIPVFSKIESTQICKAIEDQLSADIGDCRKLCNND